MTPQTFPRHDRRADDPGQAGFAGHERRVAALRNQSLDPDMLDERARVLLNFSRKDDIIIFTPTR